MKTRQILMAGALALSMVLSGGMLTGCSNSSNTKDTKTTEVAKKKEIKTIGQKSKDSKSLKMTNNTGRKSQYLKQNQVQKNLSVITCWKMEMQ